MAARCITSTELRIDSISVSPPDPVEPQWVLLSLSNSPTDSVRVYRPYAERSRFVAGGKVTNVTPELPLQYVSNGYFLMASTYQVV